MSEDHPKSRKLAAWLDGELPERDRRELTRHVEVCLRCRDEVRALRRLSGTLDDLPERAGPPEDAWAAVEAAIGGGSDADEKDGVGWRSWAAGITATAAAAVVMWVYIGSGVGDGSTPRTGEGRFLPSGNDASPIRTLDRATADIREALRRDPDDPYLRRYLARTRRLRTELEQELRLERASRSTDPAPPGQGVRR